MQRKLLKYVLIIFTVILFLLSINVMATDDNTNSVTNTIEDVENAEEEEENDNVTGSTSPVNKTSYSSTTYKPQTSQPTTSYSTVATIPEANLSLNNILNVILIAVGVIIILLAIAIFIRLK